jgi:hypothetical protein
MFTTITMDPMLDQFTYSLKKCDRFYDEMLLDLLYIKLKSNLIVKTFHIQKTDTWCKI